MRLDEFNEGLRTWWDGDPQVADHPVDRRFEPIPGLTGGMATENKLALLNLAASCLEPDEVFLEVGSYIGTSIIGAALGHDDRQFITIDNFSLFGGPKEQCLDNVRRLCPAGNVSVIEEDAWVALARDLTSGRKIGAYFYDGGHSFVEQFQAFEAVESRLADQAVIIVDDTARRSIAAANKTYTRGRSDYRLVRRFESPRNGDPRWWNGIEVYAFTRQPTSKPTPRGLSFQAVRATWVAGHRLRAAREQVQRKLKA